MEHQGHDHDGCCKSSGSSVCQSLPEMDFQRGIWHAAQTDDMSRVVELLQKGTSPAEEDSAGYTALHYAARSGNFQVCKILLDYGANVNTMTRCGRATALHRAATQGNDEIIQLFLNFRADVNIQDSDGYTPLHRAALSGSTSTWELLAPRTNQDLVDNKGRTALDLLRKNSS
ncbi:ankyrin repeat domain-containing protein 39 isoform X1 [Fopius arisanus]|uniref:ANKRD39_2 protein n=1 Tax=Fopius arisanus TaxID=64838 RepID=A0A0C9PU60_9HYME|nr:PREDICTED: ankyrin repeat domain-containing protein 39-like isoform X1 [Fopius arisanus]